MNQPQHYLKNELYKLIEVDSSIFEFIQSGSLDGLWYWDLQQPEHEWLSERFWTLLGHDPKTKQHLAAEWQDLIHPDDLNTAMNNFKAHCDNPNHPYDQIVRYRHKTGSTVWVRCRGIVIRDDGGKPYRMLGAHTDITTLKEGELELEYRNIELNKAQIKAEQAQLRAEKSQIKAEQALLKSEQSQKIAEEANKSKSQFLSHMSHELRSPLNSVIGFAEILKAELYGPHADVRYRDYAQQIFSSGNHLLNLIGDILDLTKIESGELELENIDFDFIEILQEIYGIMRKRAEEKGINFSLDIPSGIASDLTGDPTRLKQVLVNLVDNALKFTDKGDVSIRAEVFNIKSNSADVRFSVLDTGIGIESDKQERLFEPFIQADRSTTRYFGGTGLGLSICKKLVMAMHGEIHVESAEGQGSCFWFQIPFKLSTQPHVVNNPVETNKIRPLKILLVDDMDVNLMVARAVLEFDKHIVTTAKNGFEAVEAVQKNHYDLILMDIHMPRMDGLGATRHIRSNEDAKKANIPIFAVTADVMKEQVEQYINIGMNDCLSKPIQREELRRAIAKIT